MDTPYYHITCKVRQVGGIYDYLRIVGEHYQNLFARVESLGFDLLGTNYSYSR
jgi:hypothetical protein